MIGDNVFVATVYIDEVILCVQNRTTRSRLTTESIGMAVAINTGTNFLPSVAITQMDRRPFCSC